MGKIRNKLKDTYTKIHNESVGSNQTTATLTIYVRLENIWNRTGKGKYKFSFHLWVGMWVRKK